MEGTETGVSDANLVGDSDDPDDSQVDDQNVNDNDGYTLVNGNRNRSNDGESVGSQNGATQPCAPDVTNRNNELPLHLHFPIEMSEASRREWVASALLTNGDLKVILKYGTKRSFLECYSIVSYTMLSTVDHDGLVLQPGKKTGTHVLILNYAVYAPLDAITKLPNILWVKRQSTRKRTE